MKIEKAKYFEVFLVSLTQFVCFSYLWWLSYDPMKSYWWIFYDQKKNGYEEPIHSTWAQARSTHLLISFAQKYYLLLQNMEKVLFFNMRKYFVSLLPNRNHHWKILAKILNNKSKLSRPDFTMIEF